MTFSKIVLASAIAFTFAGTQVFAQTATTTTTKEQDQKTMDTSYYNKGSVWIKDNGQAKEYLKSVGAEEKVTKPQAQPTIYQQNGSVWCKYGTVVDREKGVSCADAPKK